MLIYTSTINISYMDTSISLNEKVFYTKLCSETSCRSLLEYLYWLLCFTL